MEAPVTERTPATDRPAREWRGWARLGLGFLAIWFLVFFVAPWLERWELIGNLHAHIREKEIDASALFYTEVEEFSRAEQSVRESLTY